MRKEQIQISVDIETSQGVKNFQVLLDENKKINAEMRKLKRNGKENTDEFKKLEAQSKKLNAEMHKLGGAGANMGQLIARSKQLNRQLRSLTPGTKKFIATTQELRKVNTRLKGIRDEVKGVNSALTQTRILGMKVPGVFQKIGGGMNVMKNAMNAFIALQVIQFFVDIFRAVDQTTQAFVKLRGSIEQNTGASGDDLDEFAVRTDAMSKTFRKDNEQMLIAATALTKQLTGDFSKSLDLIEAGFLNGSDNSGELLDQIKEYPAFFREMGLSGEQMISIISQSVKGGVFSDKGVDLLKEFNIRVREMPKATKEAFRAIGTSSEEIRKEIDEKGVGGAFTLIQEKLKVLKEDSPEVGQALADIFGGPGEDAGIRFVKQLDLTEKSMTDLIDTSYSYTAGMQAQLEANKELAEAQNKMAKGFKGTSNSLKLYITQLKAYVTNIAVSVLKFFEQLPATGEGIKAAFNQIGTNISSFWKKLLIDAEIAMKQISKLSPFGDTNQQINDEIAILKSKRAELTDMSMSVGKAYNEAFIAGLKDVEVNKRVAEAMTPAPAPATIKKRAKQNAKTYVDAEAKALAEVRAMRAQQPVAKLGTIQPSAAGISSDGSAEINTQAQEDLIKNKFLKALITEGEYEAMRFQLQQEAYTKRLAYIAEKHSEESAAYVALENDKLTAQQEYEAQRQELTRRTEEARQVIQSSSLSATSDFISATIDLIKEEQGERAKNSLALKAFAVGKVVIDTQEAIMAIIKNAQSNPANILFPGAGNLISGIKIATVIAKSGLALSKIKKQGFYEGGMTGNHPLFRDNQGRGVVGAVHKNEWVAPEWQVQHPVFGEMIGYLETMRQRGFQEGGFASAMPSASVHGQSTKELEAAVREMVESNRALATSIQKKQFTVTTGQVADALDEEYRLRNKSGF